MKTIDVKQCAEQLRQSNAELIDVRTPVEFREVHAEGATNIPLDRLDPKAFVDSRNGNSGQPFYVICRSGNRSTQAAQRFLDAGINEVVNVEGGTSAWESAGLPVQRGKKAISLERQVRIAAGLLVIVGVLLAMFIHPCFMGLSAFVGAGLVFAGVTDTCGMGMLLAKMPWNQCSSTGSCSV
ncbi:rhodanese-like domain-containing protein [Rhodopirellula halodulae]|uniref:rhodanese-like domain-containing protein n=1 Tax=Rhodopirellula halodulae TaxID=2894198 RepID=UPI001E370C6D|nr:rhodanese-like domain-containing protein [Rhodopirellula sp. JC737]MCC9656266.1 rhodanese-like domain-containing protein [Rhodopirellula sp. JC737]